MCVNKIVLCDLLKIRLISQILIMCIKWLSQPVSCWFPWETLQVNYGLFAERFQNGCVCVRSPFPARLIQDRREQWAHGYGRLHPGCSPPISPVHGYSRSLTDLKGPHFIPPLPVTMTTDTNTTQCMEFLHVYFQKHFSRWISFKLLPYLNGKNNDILHEEN